MLPVLVALLCAGCESWWTTNQNQPSEESKPKEPPPLYLGTVQQVYPAQKFVLLRIIGPMPSSGSTLISHPADGSSSRIANLRVSPDSSPRNGMLVADVRAGVAAVGDRVFLYRDISEAPSGDSSPGDPSSDGSPRYVPPVPTVNPDRSSVTTPPQEPPTAPDSSTTEQSSPAAAASPSDGQQPPQQPVSPDADSAPGSPPADSEQDVPSYLKDIPDDVSGWN